MGLSNTSTALAPARFSPNHYCTPRHQSQEMHTNRWHKIPQDMTLEVGDNINCHTWGMGNKRCCMMIHDSRCQFSVFPFILILKWSVTSNVHRNGGDSCKIRVWIGQILPPVRCTPSAEEVRFTQEEPNHMGLSVVLSWQNLNIGSGIIFLFKKWDYSMKKVNASKEELEGAEIRHVGHGVNSFKPTNKITWQITSNNWETL